MSKGFLKFCITTIGLVILISCIINEVDGIGRAAMVFSGVIFVYVGSLGFNEKI